MGKNVGFIGYGKIARHTAELLNLSSKSILL